MARVGDVVAAPVPGGRIRVVRLLGEGGQGAVFEVVAEGSGERLALKWYHPQMASPGQKQALELLVECGPPDEAYLWPMAVVPHNEEQDVGPADDPSRGSTDPARSPRGFGYLMPLRGSTFRGVADLLAGRVDIGYTEATSLCLGLAHSFLLLHSQGLCYRDISFGNVFFDPEDGSVLICDCDNVGVDGASESMVLGTRRFMAPEIVRGQAGPSTQTDLFSLAVLLFYVLMAGHPLLGRRELDFAPQQVAAAEEELFGTRPLFVFDPDDDSNAPLPQMHGAVAENWGRYPDSIRALFTRSFTQGLVDPQHGRVRESVWRRELLALRDRIAQCGTCGAEYFADLDGPREPTAHAHVPCWSCGNDPGSPLRLNFGDKTLVLTESTRVLAHHVRHDYDLTSVVAQVSRHPTRPTRWGLRNTSPRVWRVAMPGGAQVDVPEGSAVALVPGARFDFGEGAAVLER